MTDILKYDVAIIGAGPAGSSAAIHLGRLGYKVCLIEKKNFPRETLCGEFLSREVSEILSSLGLIAGFMSMNPNPINSFKFVSGNGKVLKTGLQFTGYGLKRGKFDAFLLSEAAKSGAGVIQPAEVKSIVKTRGQFDITFVKEGQAFQVTSPVVIAAWGRQNTLDKLLGRDFASYKSSINGIKFHISDSKLRNFPKNEIHIYAGEDIYCGINAVDNNSVTICFLENRTNFTASPRAHFKALLQQNKTINEIFTPDIHEVLAESTLYGTGHIYFGKRNLVENGIFMTGDAARVIAPLAGDGIAIALHSGRIVSDTIDLQFRKTMNPGDSENHYVQKWNRHFSRRITTARCIQSVILNPLLDYPAYLLARLFPSMLNGIIRLTRG